MANAAERILAVYSTIYQNVDLDSISSRKQPLHLPLFSSDEVNKLLREACDIFENEPVSLEIDGPVNIVGDLHGHLLDLFRVLQYFDFFFNNNNNNNFFSDENSNNENNNNENNNYKNNNKTKFKLLFLGDLVDRGEFSLETVTIVLALKVKYPENVFIIRGNHEFSFLNERCGFQDEITKVYGSNAQNQTERVHVSIFDNFQTTFSYMPLTAIVNKTILCVHGGLGPNWFSLSQAKKIERPIIDFGDEILDAMLWSDPNETVDFYEPSNRGTGFFFGQAATTDFLESNSLKLLVRAHECVNSGINFVFDEKVVTVFGASNYCGLVSNKAGVLQIDEDGNYETKIFPPFQYLKRDSVTFLYVIDGKLVPISNKRSNINESMSTIHLPPMKSPQIPKLPPLGMLSNSSSQKGVGGSARGDGGNASARKPITPHSDPRVHRPLIGSGRGSKWNDAGRPHIKIPR